MSALGRWATDSMRNSPLSVTRLMRRAPLFGREMRTLTLAGKAGSELSCQRMLVG